MNGPQLDMFLSPGPVQAAMRDIAPPFQRHSATSKAAAEGVRPKAPSYRAGIVGFVKGRGAQGATNEEICEELGIKLQTVCPRVLELREMGELVDSGRTRETRSRRPAVVWVHKAVRTEAA